MTAAAATAATDPEVNEASEASEGGRTLTPDDAHEEYLRGELARLRLLVARHIAWLRVQWASDPLQPAQGLVVSDAQADRLLEGEDPDARLRFAGTDSRARQLTERIYVLRTQLDVVRAALREADTPTPADILAALFGLSPFERDVLLLCLAPRLDPAFERLYAYAHDDVHRGHVTAHLAIALLCTGADGDPAGDPADGPPGDRWWGPDTPRACFTPDAPLVRFSLIVVDPAPVAAPEFRPVRLDDRIGDFLLGIDRLDDRLDDLLRPVPAVPLGDVHLALADGLAQALRAPLAGNSRPIVNLVGPTGSGRSALARALCDRLGQGLFELDVSLLPPVAGAESHPALRLLEREAALGGFALYIDATGAGEPPGSGSLRAVTDLITRLRLPLLVASAEPWRGERAALTARLPELDAACRRELWTQVLATPGAPGPVPADQVGLLAEQFAFGPRGIAEAVAAAARDARLRAGTAGTAGTAGSAGAVPRPSADDLWDACRAVAGFGLGELAQRLPVAVGWSDIVLPADTLAQLTEIADQVAYRPRVYDGWGFGARLGRGRGVSALFCGPSGTGKTMAAEVLAGALRLDLYRVDLSGVVDKYIGETEKNLRRVFDAAERTGAMLLFDEADALFGRRTEVRDSHDRYANIEVDYLLQRMEEYRGLAILTTNQRSALDRAFLRRLRFLVEFPFPDAEGRRQIWRRCFPPSMPVDDLDFGALAMLEIPGGTIASIALNAAFLAAGRGVPVGMEHVIHAARREYVKTDRQLSPAEFGRYYQVVLS